MRLYSVWVHAQERNKVELVAYDSCNAFYRRFNALVNNRIKMMPLKRFKAIYEPFEGMEVENGCAE